MNTKGDLSINYIFLIFIATIATFVIIGLIVKWSGDAGNFVSQLNEKDVKDPIVDNQIIKVDECSDLQNEVIKHAKLCYTKASQGKVRGNLCYAISSTGCNLASSQVQSGLSSIDHVVASALGDNIIINYDYEKKIVEVK